LGKIYQKIPFSDIRLAVDDTYQVPLYQIFSGPDMSFGVQGFYNSTVSGTDPYISQRY